jgi:hemolysin activation/secretion protein
VESNELLEVTPFEFLIRQQTLEGSAAYRSALSNFVDLPGDVAVGLEAVHQNRNTSVFGIPLVDISMDVFQAYAEWSYHWSDPFGRSSISAKAHGSPGGLTFDNSPLAYFIYTNGRARSATYVYGGFDFSRVSLLPFGVSLSSEVAAQYASGPLPDPEQLAIGGPGSVRGYVGDDGAFDQGIWIRNELHSPPVPTVGTGLYALAFAPMIFLDAGYGRDASAAPGQITSQTMVSTGVGTTVQIGRFVSGQLTASFPLLNARYSRLGETRLDASVTIAY